LNTIVPEVTSDISIDASDRYVLAVQGRQTASGRGGRADIEG